MLFTQLSTSHFTNMVSIQLLGSWKSHPIPLPSLHGGEETSLSGCLPPDDTFDSESVVGIKPSDFGVVTEYQVDQFTHTCLAESFVVQLHIYTGFTVQH